MEAKLVVVRGKASKGDIALKLPTVIGRSREADLTVAHPTISRKHCEIYEEGGTLRLRDLGSLNGTFLGKRQIKETELAPDDEFSLGPLTFRVVYQRSGAAALAPASPVGEAAGEGVPDFVLQDEDIAPEKATLQATPARANGAPSKNDDDILDFLIDEEPQAKKAGGDGGTDDDELDQFFKQLG